MELRSGRAQGSSLSTLFEESVRRNPNAIALVDGKLFLTYEQLDSRADAAARRLAALGAGPGKVVGLVARRTADAIAALLGILKAGAAYCPLDPAYPLERLRVRLEDSGAAALVAGREDARKLAGGALPVVLLDGFEGRGPDSPAAVPGGAGPDDLAYVIYTSGSTGKPKGVMVEHSSAVNFVRAMLKMDVIGPGERTLFFTSMSFDVSVGEIFPCLCSGAALFLRGETLLPAREFIRSVEEMKIERLFLPTAYWHELAAALAPLGETPPSCLRSVIMAGEALRAESLAYWRPAAHRVRLINGYGPTEATVCASFYEVPADSPSSGIVPIGRSAAGAQLHVVDPAGRPSPDGSAGELWIGGPGVARGYLNRPELTSARFIPDPFSGRPGARVYRTGDRVRRRPDGALEYLGRFDDQVKIRGFRVELGEVESALAAHPAVGTCAVVLREERGVQRLVAYVSPSGAPAASVLDLRAFLVGRLPDHMVPAVIVSLPLLPLTPAGKVDRRALPPPPEASATAGERAPTPLESLIRGIWEEALGLSSIGLKDDFSARGGNSLLAVRIMAMIEKRIGRRPPLWALCRGVTIESLAAAMGEETRARDEAVLRFGPASGREPIFFVHPGLGGLYCQELSRAMPDRPVYLLTGLAAAKTASLPSIEEIARGHVETLRAIHHGGPHRLCGYSIGATIAYEMARQLEASGEEISKLILVGAPLEDSFRWWTAARRAVSLLGGPAGKNRRAMLNLFSRSGKVGQFASGLFSRRGAVKFLDALRRALSRAKTKNGSAGGLRALAPTEFDETLKALLWAAAAYRPKPYRGPATFIEVEDPYQSRNVSDYERLALTPLAEQVLLPYDHDEIVTTHAAELGAAIGRLLSGTGSQGGGALELSEAGGTSAAPTASSSTSRGRAASA
jgi:amino acid adenylation domain-containing protein